MREIELARGWPIRKVKACLESDALKMKLADFIDARYTERFFNPILLLDQNSKGEHVSGFAIMALCCLLVETLQCYRDGLPSTDSRDVKRIDEAVATRRLVIPAAYGLLEDDKQKMEGVKTFKRFFDGNRGFFPNISENDFYYYIRCGLLHQSQTMNKWRVTTSGMLWDDSGRGINRKRFVTALRQCFRGYLDVLRIGAVDKAPWPKALRKIWWLTTLSEVGLRD